MSIKRTKSIRTASILAVALFTSSVAIAEPGIAVGQAPAMPFPQPPVMAQTSQSVDEISGTGTTSQQNQNSIEGQRQIGKKINRDEKRPTSSAPSLIVGPSSTEAFDEISEIAQSGQILDTSVTVLPEVATPVEVSSSDINRISCTGEIKDIVYSKEKGLIVKFTGNNAFVKFLIRKADDKEVYAKLPSEMYIVCGDNVYNLIAIPKKIPGRTIRLSNGSMEKIKKNNSIYGSLPLEKKILSLLKSVYTDDIPDTITATKIAKNFPVYQDISINLDRLLTVEGEGLKIKEYHVTLSKDAKKKIELREKQFLRNDLATKPIAISIDNPILKPGQTARVIIFESVAEREKEVAEW